MEKKYTPGPWVAEGWENTVVNGSDGVTLALHPGDGRKHGLACVKANARLIAAAPELLEALQGLVADWERVHGDIPFDHEAKAAIAKAVGG